MTKTVVSRAKWLRGEGWKVSKLLRSSDEKMCCLGFACLQRGKTVKEITDVSAPDSFWFPKMDLAEAMNVNDNPLLSDEIREKRLKRIFADAGEEIEFVA